MSHSPKILECMDGVKCGIKMVEIGDWNMDSTTSKNVAHGLAVSDIVAVTAYIRNDDNDEIFNIAGKDSSNLAAQIDCVDSTNVCLSRMPGQFFDSNDFDATSYNRGFIRIYHRLG